MARSLKIIIQIQCYDLVFAYVAILKIKSSKKCKYLLSFLIKQIFFFQRLKLITLRIIN